MTENICKLLDKLSRHNSRAYGYELSQSEILQILKLFDDVKELEQYRAIGTVEECRTAYGRGYNQGTIDRAEEIQKAREYGYAKAIDEFADAIKNTLPIAVHRDCSEIDYEIDYALYNMRHKIDKIAEELKEGAE